MKKIFITATNTDIGKTYTTLKFAKILAKMGYRVAIFKPIETGVKKLPNDGKQYLKLLKQINPDLKDFSIDNIVPIQYHLPASPFVAKGNKRVNFKKISKKLNLFKPYCDILLIEGAGGILVPIEKNFFMIDLVKKLKIDKTILITSSKLGAINDTLLSINTLKKRNIEFNWAVNLYLDRDSFYKITYPFYKEYFKRVSILKGKKSYKKFVKNYLIGD